LLDRFVALARVPRPVLDLGCGPGQPGTPGRPDRFAARGLVAHGIDLSPEMIRVAKELVPEATFEVGDLLDLRLAPGAHGGAVLLYSIIHLLREDLTGVLASAAAALAPEAPVLVSAHRGEGFKHSEEVFGRRVPLSATLYEPAEIARAAENAGLDVLLCETRPPYQEEYQTERIYVLARRR
jgi:SAM-dependent methyltransferase